MTQLDFENLRQYDLETLMKAEAETHDAILQFEIGLRYCRQGDAAETKQKASECYLTSAKWFRKSNAQGDPVAGVILGCFYGGGIGVKQNGEKAFRLFMKYATVNYTAALMVAECYEHGEGAEQNIEKALEWYTKAVNSDIKEVTEAAEKYLKILSLQKTWQEKNMDMVIVDKKKNYAIGLRYYGYEYPAPIITKRETGERAKKLCNSANESGITVIKNESLARGIYNDTFIGCALPEKYIDENILKDVLVAYAKMITRDYIRL